MWKDNSIKHKILYQWNVGLVIVFLSFNVSSNSILYLTDCKKSLKTMVSNQNFITYHHVF